MDRQVAVVLVALLMVGTAVPAAVASGGSSVDADYHEDDEESTADDEPKVAEKAYIKENGDAVLVYKNDESDSDRESSFGAESDSTATAKFGLDVSAGLADLLVRDNLTSDVTGDGVAVLTPNRFEGNGSVAGPTPESLESMTFDLTSETSSDTQSVDASLEATGFGSYLTYIDLKNAQTSGTMTVTPDTFTLDGEGSMHIDGQEGDETETTFTITEKKDQFIVEATNRRPIYSYSEEQWNTSEAARETLRQQYVMAAEDLEGDAQLTIKNYSYEPKEQESDDSYGFGKAGIVDVSFKVTYTDIEKSLADRLVTSLSSSEEYDLDQTEAEAIERDIRNVEFTRVHVSSTSSGTGSYDVEFDSEIGNYTAGANAALRLQAAHEVSSETQVERLRKKIAARQASNLKQTTTWSASIKPKADTVEISASLTADSKNWDSYVNQLKQRDIDIGTTTLDAHVETDGDEISGTMTFSVERQGLIKKTIKPYLEAAKNDDRSEEWDSETKSFVTAIRDAEFRKAKMNFSADGEQFTTRAALAADNMSAIQPLLADTYGGTVTSMYGNTTDDGETTTTYVHVEGLTGDDPSEEDVRGTDVVDEETTVAMQGTWDREFPRLKTDDTREYLGIGSADGQSAGTVSGNETGMGTGTGALAPGFTALTAAIALALVAATLVARRRD